MSCIAINNRFDLKSFKQTEAFLCLTISS